MVGFFSYWCFSHKKGRVIFSELYFIKTTLTFCLLQLFLENLEHEDSFIYLSAIQGINKCSVWPNLMFTCFAKKFADWFILRLFFRSGSISWFLPWEDPGKAAARFPTWSLPSYIQQGALPRNPPQSRGGPNESQPSYGWASSAGFSHSGVSANFL